MLDTKYISPCKQGANSSETPETKHVEQAVLMQRARGNDPSKFRRDSGYNIKSQPRSCVLFRDFPRIINDKVRASVQICHEEREDDINSEKSIDNVVHDGKRPFWFIKKPEFERGNPSSVDDQNNQKRLP